MYNHCIRFPTHTRKNDFPLSLSVTLSPAHEKRVQNTHDFERNWARESESNLGGRRQVEHGPSPLSTVPVCVSASVREEQNINCFTPRLLRFNTTAFSQYYSQLSEKIRKAKKKSVRKSETKGKILFSIFVVFPREKVLCESQTKVISKTIGIWSNQFAVLKKR